MQIADLTHVNAALNTVTIVLLSMGYRCIRRGERERHRTFMLAAAAVSAAFLASYLVYHFNAGLAKFGGEGMVRQVYFTLLIIHVLAAVVITGLVPVTLVRALAGRFDRHRRIARITWPIWMFVAVSGVIVYLMAVHFYPYAGTAYAG
ncbi:MAG: DUF420 domain-containing protein [Rhodospirillales bacterium]|nr:DUF420 domain-containing protein [Rhodospirillales bacterium]